MSGARTPEYVINISSDDEDDYYAEGIDDDNDAAIQILEFRKETTNLLNNPHANKSQSMNGNFSNDAPKIVKTLNDVECPICFDHLENATVTTCGHIFCLECIQQSISSSSARGQTRGKKGLGLCPLCREKVVFKNTVLLRIKTGPKVVPPANAESNVDEDKNEG